MVAKIIHKKIPGFTLIEMTLYVAICSILLFSLSTLFAHLVGARVKSQAVNEVNQQGEFLLYSLTYAIRNAQSVDVPLLGTSSQGMSLTTFTPSLNPTVFSASGSTFFVQEAGGTAIPLTNNRVSISNLLFENVSSASSTDRIVRIMFTLSARTQAVQQEYNYTKTFKGSATLRQ
jgi:type II secretory pathway pseudopilin PulG